MCICTNSCISCCEHWWYTLTWRKKIVCSDDNNDNYKNSCEHVTCLLVKSLRMDGSHKHWLAGLTIIIRWVRVLPRSQPCLMGGLKPCKIYQPDSITVSWLFCRWGGDTNIEPARANPLSQHRKNCYSRPGKEFKYHIYINSKDFEWEELSSTTKASTIPMLGRNAVWWNG